MEHTEEVLSVAPGFGQHKNIQQAINAANPGARIVVSPGLYTRAIKINKPGLILQAKQTNGEVQLSVNSGPLISISLNQGQTCAIKGFKFIHTGEQRHQYDQKWFTNLKLRDDMNCALWVNEGVVTIQDCQVTLGSTRASMPAIVVHQGELNLKYCDIKGNGEFGSIGVYCRDSSLAMHSCKVYKHRNGGIVLENQPEFVVEVSQCAVLNNARCGILCTMESAAPIIQHNRIMQNEGPGIMVMRKNKAKLKENEIKYNEVGIQVMDADPFIVKNKIRCNFGNGIQIKTNENGCQVNISGNHISENENGILVRGDDCNAIIDDNIFIGHNRKSGIRLEDSGYADIRSNQIFQNVWQGILLVTGTSAQIEKNRISGNLRANIAFGRGSIKITDNRISKGRCEGIFGFKPNNCKVLSNEIYENNDGILVVDGYLEVVGNSVHDNKRTGITLAGKGEVTLMQNQVYRNSAVGFNIRDNVFATLTENKGFENPIQICILSKNQDIDIKQVKQQNEWSGEVQLPLPNYCSLFQMK